MFYLLYMGDGTNSFFKNNSIGLGKYMRYIQIEDMLCLNDIHTLGLEFPKCRQNRYITSCDNLEGRENTTQMPKEKIGLGG